MSITIGIPFYNAERYLADSIRSVFAQTYTDWELILIDDGSTDNSLAIAKSVKDPRVRVFSDGKNKKLATRLNEIVKLAKYDIIARMDADDLMSPTRIEKQLAILNNNPSLDLVSTGVVSVTDNLEIIGKRGTDNSNISLNDLLYKKTGIVHAAIIGRRIWFEKNRYDTSLKIAQDYELWLRTAKNNDLKIQIIKDPLYFYREEGNATYKKLIAAYKNERKMYRKYAGKHFCRLVLKSFLKTIIIFILNFFNRIDLLLINRNSKREDPNLNEVFERDIIKIKNTHVKGLDTKL